MKANKINRNPLLLVWALKTIVTPHDTNKPRSTEMIILYWETLEQFRYVKIHAWLRGLGEYWLTTCVIHLRTTKVISCFIPPSLTAKYEFINIHWYCTIPLTFAFNWSPLHWQFLIYFHNVWNLCNKVCKKMRLAKHPAYMSEVSLESVRRFNQMLNYLPSISHYESHFSAFRLKCQRLNQHCFRV